MEIGWGGLFTSNCSSKKLGAVSLGFARKEQIDEPAVYPPHSSGFLPNLHTLCTGEKEHLYPLLKLGHLGTRPHSRYPQPLEQTG
jgi:hypothetical protein